MPIYEYICNECGYEFETLQKMSDAPLSDCPECKKSALKKKISAPGFRLSGSGWYETDFKSSNQKNLSKSDSSEKSAPAKSDKAPAKSDKAPAKSTGKEGSAKKEAAA